MIVGIVGLGLMGGSLGLALQNTKLVSKIVGFDHNLSHCEEALRLGLVHEIVSFNEIKTCDIIFLAIPVGGIIKALQELKDVSEKTTIIDLGSTKAEILDAVPHNIRQNFIAAHPMTGTEKFGPSAAIQNLYHDKVVVLCDTDQSGDLHKNRAIQIFSHIGMKIVFMDPHSHDAHAAFISHLPHALSYALANSVMGQEDPKSILLLAAGGFRDMSRIAKSSPQMWSNIFKQNKQNILKSIEIFEEELHKSKKMMEEEDWEGLESWMSKATTLHKIL
ncbi:prephenate dehydrogenase [Sulfurospirillum deleyianum]|uniref:prephenate dehydrogenase n=1 Tax=Sulfurospirillum deleyianum (strain ATCC 51133 / DSM 6946 / 5175) TaxID=525898 RepID=D1B0E9_SULD5|nr:prephenate dehydrogenase [Sulfurospirillum deleyianum]ACZ11268.1 Prephenate dehydrogenase [Sulfurospirillum deleyianum DSM 6946]